MTGSWIASKDDFRIDRPTGLYWERDMCSYPHQTPGS